MKIIDIIDTRDSYEEGDRIIRIPGTGQNIPCDICNENHEIHVLLETDHGILNVGLGCAKKMNGVDRLIKIFEIEKALSNLTPPEKIKKEIEKKKMYNRTYITYHFQFEEHPELGRLSIGGSQPLKFLIRKYSSKKEKWKKYFSTKTRLINRLASLNSI